MHYPFFTHKREKEQICPTLTKEQACLNETEGLELIRLLQMRRLTYLTKLTPQGMISSSILAERSCARGTPPSQYRLARRRYRRARSLGSLSPD